MKRQRKTVKLKDEKISTTVRLPENVRRRAKMHAAELGITLEQYVERALQLFHQQPVA
ncbi:MAG TPA: toxin-antitoxin system HicB family antitoxin [Anaerolineales bacterium]|nr:toxin-antitoxin system HicB family antitoxin [Anaerolineales bacterium]